jgi:hypothetical protein
MMAVWQSIEQERMASRLTYGGSIVTVDCRMLTHGGSEQSHDCQMKVVLR